MIGKIAQFDYNFNGIILNVSVIITSENLSPHIDIEAVHGPQAGLSKELNITQCHYNLFDIDGIKLNNIDLDVVLLEEAYSLLDSGEL
jgi:hypothetical protein